MKVSKKESNCSTHKWASKIVVLDEDYVRFDKFQIFSNRLSFICSFAGLEFFIPIFKTAIADVNYLNTGVDEKKKSDKQQQPVTNYVLNINRCE